MFLSKKAKQSVAVLCFVLMISNSFAQRLISVKPYTDAEISQIFEEGLKGKSEIVALKTVYSTTDIKGDTTKASGLMLIPKVPKPENLPFVVYEHGSTFPRHMIPSELTCQADYAAYFASSNYITIAPDYLGLGENPGLHPYMHAITEATATIDMIRAARRYFKDSLNTVIRNDIYLTGYSQGGHVAMATHKYIEENNLTDEFPIKASAPCSGPYSLSGVMWESILYSKEIMYCDPEVLINTIIAYQYIYGNLYKHTSDYFKEPYDSIVDSYIESDRGFELNNYFPLDLNNFMHDSVFVNCMNNPDHPLLKDLRKNDVYNWKPEASVKMYYTTADEMVPYQNAIIAQSEMKKNGAKDAEAIEVSTTLKHDPASVPIMQQVLKWFNEIESGNSQAINKINNKINRGKLSLTVFPNPVNDDLYIDLNANSNDDIQSCLYDLNGRLLYAFPAQKLKSDNPVLHYNLRGLLTAKQLYIINIRCNGYRINAGFLANR
jgi:hypothetical protein